MEFVVFSIFFLVRFSTRTAFYFSGKGCIESIRVIHDQDDGDRRLRMGL